MKGVRTLATRRRVAQRDLPGQNTVLLTGHTIGKAFHLPRRAPVRPFAETLPAGGAAAFADLTRTRIGEYARTAHDQGSAWASGPAA